MRQLLNEHEHSMVAAAEIRSRNISHERMLRSLVAEPGRRELARSVVAASNEAAPDDVQPIPAGPFEANLPAEGWFGRLSTAIAHVLGHMATISLYWICIFFWLGFGHYCGWSNMWQLYISSGTSALMVFVCSFLANINERHDHHTQQSLNVIYQVDSALELKLRLLTGDSLDNQPVVLPPPRVNPLQRAIYYSADVVGTLIGIVLLLLVTVVWVVIGPAMSFNSNWWLLIGTYAGLIGLNDGFVLRNVQAQLRTHENEQFVAIEVDDAALFGAIDAVPPKGIAESSSSTTRTLTHRISLAMGRICAHEMTVLTGFLVIVGLLIGASAMGWSTTGQLLCNVPPSIIESFFMIVLITGHNLGDTQKRIDLQNIYHRRLQLLGLVQRFEAAQLLFTEKMAIPAVDQLEVLPVHEVAETLVSGVEVTVAAVEE